MSGLNWVYQQIKIPFIFMYRMVYSILKWFYRKIKIILREINPTYLFYITYIVILIIWVVPYYAKSQLKSFFLVGILILTSILFFHKLISFLFNPNNLLTLKMQSFDGKPEEAIDYLINEAENWVNDILKLITIIQLNKKNDEKINQEDEKIEQKIYRYYLSLYNLYLRLYCLVKLDKRLKGKIQIKETDLDRVFSRISEFIGAERGAIERLVGVRTDVDPRIIQEVINNYELIKKEINKPEIDREIDQINKRFKDKQDRLKKLKGLNEDIISDIISEIKESSTGKATTSAANILQSAKDVEELKWLIAFVNSRIGFRIAELLCLELEKMNPQEIVKWCGKIVVETSDKKRCQDYMSHFQITQNIANELCNNFKSIYEINVNSEKVHEIILEDQANEILNKARNMVDFKDVIIFLKIFNDLRDNAVNELWKNFYDWKWDDIRRDIFNPYISQPLSIALTYGYSSILEFILNKIIDKVGQRIFGINMVQLLLIQNKQKIGDEEFLRAELMGKHPQIKVSIMPPDAIEERGLQIGNVFVGIESIDISGDIVHPRGSVEVIKIIKNCAPNAFFYAVGETYKVKYFKRIFIDYTKLAFFKHGDINYVVTNHGIHRLEKKLLFDWNEIQKTSKNKLKDSLKNYFYIDWMDNWKIKSNEKTIQVVTNDNKIFINITLNEDKKRANLKFQDGRTYSLIVNKENDKLNVYKGDWELRNNGRWKPIECKIFRWTKIPGKDDDKLKEFLIYNYGLNWIKECNFYNKSVESDGTKDGDDISAFYENESISIKFSDKKTKAILMINNSITDEFIVKTETDELNIYDPIEHSLCCCRCDWENTIEEKINLFRKVEQLYSIGTTDFNKIDAELKLDKKIDKVIVKKFLLMIRDQKKKYYSQVLR